MKGIFLNTQKKHLCNPFCPFNEEKTAEISRQHSLQYVRLYRFESQNKQQQKISTEGLQHFFKFIQFIKES